MNNSTLLYAAVFILLSTAVFFFLRLDYVLLDMITHRAERKAKIRSFKKQSKLSKAIDKLLAKCASLIANSQMPRSAYIALTVICAIGGFFAGKVIFSSFPIALAVSTFGLIAPLLFFSFRQTKAHTAQLERLASSMMILSNSYVVTEDFITSVEDNLDILDFTLTDNEMAAIAQLDKGVRYYHRTDEQLVQFALWRPDFEKA